MRRLAESLRGTAATSRRPFAGTLLGKAKAAAAGSDDAATPMSTAWFERLEKAAPNWAAAYFAEAVTPDSIKLDDAKRGMSTSGAAPPVSVAKGSYAATAAAAGTAAPLVVAVTDDVSLSGFATRYGVAATMFHHVTEVSDHPSVHWLRRCGARFLGKLRCATPFAYTDALVVEAYPPAQAVAAGVCGFAMVGSIVGCAGLNAPCSAPVVGFTPSRASLPRNRKPPFSRVRSLGFVGPDLPRIAAGWNLVAAAAAGAASDAAAAKATSSAASPAGEEEDDADRPATIAPEDKEPLIVGIPATWLDKVNGCAPGTATRLVHAMKLATGTGRRPGRRPIDLQPVELDWELNELMDLTNIIGAFEFAEALKAKKLDGDGAIAALPEGTVAMFREGAALTEDVYTAAKARVDRFVGEWVEAMQDVDCVLVPLTAAPHNVSAQKTLATTLPFALMGCPAVSTRLPLTPIVREALLAVAAPAGFDAFAATDMAPKSSGKDGAAAMFGVIAPAPDEARTALSTLPVAVIGEAGQDTLVLESARELLDHFAVA